MARIKIDIPEKRIGQVSVPVRITDINYGKHLGNDSLVSIIHEARVMWLTEMGYNEINIEGKSVIMSDLVVTYHSESFYGDRLLITLAIGEISSSGFELYYLIETKRHEKTITIAKAKTGMVFFDYEKRKVEVIPEVFKMKIS